MTNNNNNNLIFYNNIHNYFQKFGVMPPVLPNVSPEDFVYQMVISIALGSKEPYDYSYFKRVYEFLNEQFEGEKGKII